MLTAPLPPADHPDHSGGRRGHLRGAASVLPQIPQHGGARGHHLPGEVPRHRVRGVIAVPAREVAWC